MAVLSADTFLDMAHKVFPYRYFNNIWPEAPNGPVEGDDWALGPPMTRLNNLFGDLLHDETPERRSPWTCGDPV